MYGYLEVVEVNHREDKNGRIYSRIKLSSLGFTIVNIEGIERKVHVKKKTGIYVAYKDSYIQEGSDFGANLEVGELVEGLIVSRKVFPYEINGEEQNIYTAVILCGTRDAGDFEVEVLRTFRRHKVRLLDDPKPLEVTLGKNIEPTLPSDMLNHVV